MAGEGLICAYCEGFGFEGYIFRFVSILGERYTHGHVFDFYRQLIEHPGLLTSSATARSGRATSTCRIASTPCSIRQSENGPPLRRRHRFQIYNLGTAEYVRVNDSVDLSARRWASSPRSITEPAQAGWIGDNPFIFLDTKKILATGWKPKLTIEQGIVRTVRWLEGNRWVFDARR